MNRCRLNILPERCVSWEAWQAGRAARRRAGNLVAPEVIRRKSNEGDTYLRETYGGDRGPPFNKPFDSPTPEKA